MTAPASKANKPGDLDLAKLMEMAEPITVRVVKMRGNSQQPIELPLNDGYEVSGLGFDRAGVQKVESVVRDLSGGGHYNGSATDANGVVLKWTFGWPVAQYPEKIAPADMAAAVGGVPPGVTRAQMALNGAPAQPYPAQPTSSWPPPGYATGYPAPAPGATGAPPPWGYPPPAGGFVPYPPSPYGAPPPGYPAWSPPPAVGVDPRAAALEAELQRERARATEERHQRELAAAKSSADTKIDQLAAVVAQLAEAIKAPHGESPEAIRMREQLAEERAARLRAEEKAEQIRREEAAERRHQESMAQIQAQIAAIAARPQGPDPLLEIMRESTRAQTENMREVARMNEAGINKLATQMMDPMRLAEVISKAGKGAEESFQGLTQRMFGILDMQRAAAENALQMNAQPGEHPAITVVKDAVQAAKETATRYMKSKEAEATAEAQLAAVRAQATAQERIATVQSQAHVAAAQAGAHATPTPTPGAPVVDAALNGSAPPAPEAPPEPVTTAAAPAAAEEPAPPAAPIGNTDRSQFTAKEREMFEQDVVFDAVTRLRLGVRNGLSDQLTTEAILKGIAGVRTMNIVVPAFMLYEGGHQEDFVDLLIPNAPQALKDAVVANLTTVRNGEMARAAAEEKSDAEEEGEEEDEQEEEEQDDAQEAVAS